MAVIDMNTNEWLNNDGLLVRFGTERARPARVGEFSSLFNGQHVIELHIDLAALSVLSPFASDIDVILDDTVTIPKGALLEKIELIVMEASAGAGTLDLGLYDQDRTTVIDQDGLLAASTTGWAGAVIGTTVVYTRATAEAGALMGTVLTNTGLITAQVDAAAFTNGSIKIRIYFSVPLPADLV
jgi:hypothetical protein